MDNCSGIICGLNEADIVVSCTDPTSIQYIGIIVISAQPASKTDAITSNIFFRVEFIRVFTPDA